MRTVLALLLLLLAGSTASAQEATSGPSAVGNRGMVVAVSRPAVEIGVAILKKGGNAVDAAVAVALAMAVTWPEAGNIGGGGFMLIYPGDKRQPVLIDYRETAPRAATRDMLARERPPHKMVGVPGTVRGLVLAHEKFGKLPWKDLVLPAVELAEKGFDIDAPLAASLNSGLRKPGPTAEMARVLGKSGKGTWKAGDRLVQPDLARTLRRIAEKGADGFYAGPVADLLIAEMKAHGGLITREDLAGYRARERKPVHGTYRGFDIYAPPPPSAGGIVLIEALNILEHFRLRQSDRWSPRTLHLMIEASRRAYRDRFAYIGDPDFVKIPPHLTSREHARKLAGGIKLDRATRSGDLAGDIVLTGEGQSTTHFSIIDRHGLAVSNTYTLESSFGSKVMVKGAGFLLNDEMGDFNLRPGLTDRKGNIGTTPNLIAPGKRMVSSQTPVVVVKEGKPFLITGSPGGRTITNTVLCILVNVLDFDMPLRQAVDAPRHHHAWLPDEVKMESELHARHADTLKKLRDMGHVIPTRPERQGDAHSIRIDPKSNRREGVADRRRGGWAQAEEER